MHVLYVRGEPSRAHIEESDVPPSTSNSAITLHTCGAMAFSPSVPCPRCRRGMPGPGRPCLAPAHCHVVSRRTASHGALCIEVNAIGVPLRVSTLALLQLFFWCAAFFYYFVLLFIFTLLNYLCFVNAFQHVGDWFAAHAAHCNCVVDCHDS